MKKYFSLLVICAISLGANAQSEDRAIPFPATCLLVENQISPNELGEIVFLPIQKCGIEEYHLMIFNQLGDLVFETTDSDEAWKAGADIAAGVYFWKISGNLETARTELETSGSVTVQR